MRAARTWVLAGLAAAVVLAPLPVAAQYEGHTVVLDGTRITLGRALGRGYFAAIYSGVEAGTRRELAVKIMRPPRRELPDRFDVELTVARAVEHPNLPKLYGIGRKDDGQRALVMEKLSGEPLGDADEPGGRPRPPAEAVHITIEVLRALGALHARGWRHNDLHPGNILVDGQRVHLIDLGSATRVGDHFKVTSTAYYAPEARRGEPGSVAGSVSADLYGAGAILAFLLTGEHPRSPSLTRRIADPRLRAIVDRAMHADPARRYPSAEAFVTDLEDALR
jgi:eukaryotic-like serine/threonine-protein kinase